MIFFKISEVKKIGVLRYFHKKYTNVFFFVYWHKQE